MKLYEFEGHRILTKSGIMSPFFIPCQNLEEVEEAVKRLKFPIVAKLQVLSGKRGKSGGIKFCTNKNQLFSFVNSFFGKDFLGEKITYISLCQKADIEKEFYFSITYDTAAKVPVLMFSEDGGVDIEEQTSKNPDAVKKLEIDPVDGLNQKNLQKVFGKDKKLSDFALRLWDTFSRYDSRQVEVNPAALTKDGDILAIDAKIILDDSGLSRHKELDVLEKGAVSAIPSKREVQAKEIDREDYRGSAGSTFIEFNGDIAVLASGGGASLLVMDSLVESGGKPANYTEYSGNPPRVKVEKLTKITLSKEDLSGCLVCGAVANFTDIYETLSGFAEGLKGIKPKPAYPIVIRRGGPRQEEAYEMLAKLAEKEGYNIHLFGPETPISTAAKEMVRLSDAYKLQLKDQKSDGNSG